MPHFNNKMMKKMKKKKLFKVKFQTNIIKSSNNNIKMKKYYQILIMTNNQISYKKNFNYQKKI